MNVADLNWVAGFFDGEGCVYITDEPCRSRMTITQKEKSLLEQFESIVQLGGRTYVTGKDGKYWQLVYTGSRAVRLARLIQPYLRHPDKCTKLQTLLEESGYLVEGR